VFEEIQTPPCDNLAPAPPSEMILTGGYPRVEVAPNETQNIVLQVIQVEPTSSCRLLHRALQFLPLCPGSSCCRPSMDILINSHSAVIVPLCFLLSLSLTVIVLLVLFSSFCISECLNFCIPCDCCYATNVLVLWAQYMPLIAFIVEGF
jgi:hypothetical protein